MLAIFELFWTKAMSLYTNWGCYQTLPLVPSVPFFIIVIKFDIKIVWNMKIGCGSWGPPFYRHLPTTTIDIILTLQNFRTKKQYPRHLLQKPQKVKVSLMSWFQDLWWSSTIFRMNMTESCFCQLAGSLWWVSIIWWVFIIWCVLIKW